MRIVKPFHAALLLLALASCGNHSGRYTPEDNSPAAAAGSLADSASVAASSTTAYAELPLNSPERKMVRTANIRARVNDLQDVTSRLETLVTGLHGIVAESNLQNEVVREDEYAYRPDSLRKVQVYVPTAHLLLRVPVQYMDSVVHCIGQMAAFTSTRVLKQEDVTLQWLSNQMKISAAEKSLSQPVTGDAKRHTVNVMSYTDNKQEQTINRKVNNMEMNDLAAYATIGVELFQGQLADVQVVVNPETATRARLSTAIGIALRRGAVSLREVLLLLLSCWPFLLIGMGGWLVFRRRRAGKALLKG
ncbi:MAG TPA: DUF4349 domain-containing protein [Chitinophaga sp.]